MSDINLTFYRGEHAQAKSGRGARRIVVGHNPLKQKHKNQIDGMNADCNFLENFNPTGGASISNVYFKNGISTYCCGSPISDGSSITCPADSDNDGVPFPVASGSVIAGRALLANVSSLKVTSSSDGNDTSKSGYATSTATCKACHEAAIGAGVGVPLFVLALSFLIWARFERARTSRLKRNMVATTTIAVDGSKSYRIPGGTGKRRAMTEL